MAAEHEITIRVSVFNAGCLPSLLEKEIGRVERTKHLLAAGSTPAEQRMMAAYLDQLRACLAALQEGRRA